MAGGGRGAWHPFILVLLTNINLAARHMFFSSRTPKCSNMSNTTVDPATCACLKQEDPNRAQKMTKNFNLDKKKHFLKGNLWLTFYNLKHHSLDTVTAAAPKYQELASVSHPIVFVSCTCDLASYRPKESLRRRSSI